VIVLWTWESSAPGVDGGGVSDDPGQALRTASAWIRANGAESGRAAEVLLAVGDHEPTGVALRALRGPDGSVRWASARDAA
jgi:hypothetical protein